MGHKGEGLTNDKKYKKILNIVIYLINEEVFKWPTK
jgi:hypothetical protein